MTLIFIHYWLSCLRQTASNARIRSLSIFSMHSSFHIQKKPVTQVLQPLIIVLPSHRFLLQPLAFIARSPICSIISIYLHISCILRISRYFYYRLFKVQVLLCIIFRLSIIHMIMSIYRFVPLPTSILNQELQYGLSASLPSNG